MSDKDRAQEIIDGGDPGEILRMALNSRAAADEGRYCECETPSLHGRGLMCGKCLLHNKDQERAVVDRLVAAHEFVPGELDGLLCAICTNSEGARRHHGVSAVGRTSWGEERRP